ncbi:hypothetical protein [Sodalis sp. dw_96]|uniref:hypothetical protein n=1 Tax=Sodalis sp. dw_96 TaxID=2719794 RepID=UPI001BD237E9|nr:hypothetical protein [Sodalis sp. dw_96]
MGIPAKKISNHHHGRQPGSLDHSELLRARIANLSEHFIDVLRKKDAENINLLLTLPDDQFWSEIKGRANHIEIVEMNTPEKKEHQEFVNNRNAFLAHLGKYGGVYKSSMVADILGISRPTVNKYGEQSKLIVLNWGNENLYPVFQFSIEDNNGAKGLLKGLPEILACLKNVSSVRKCNFFTRRIDTLDKALDKPTTALEILRKGASAEEIRQLARLAGIFGTPDAA